MRYRRESFFSVSSIPVTILFIIASLFLPVIGPTAAEAQVSGEVPGDLDFDCDVDRNDLNLIFSARNTPALGPDDPRDLDGDGRITVLDARKLVLLCTAPRCTVLTSTCEPDDLCPDDPDKTDPGVCGCGVADTDSDGDDTADCNDRCPDDVNKAEPGICGCGVSDDDEDGDGFLICQGDCDNLNTGVFPGAEEIPDNGIDEDCDGIDVITVPNVLDRPLENAAGILESSGLIAGTTTDNLVMTEPTGNVLDQLPLPDSLVDAGTPVDLIVAASPPLSPDEIIPTLWAGEWKIQTDFLNISGGFIESSHQTAGTICPRDPLGAALVQQVVGSVVEVTTISCTSGMFGESLEAECTGLIAFDACQAAFRGELMLLVDGDELFGSGIWTVEDICGVPLESTGQHVRISGERVSTDFAPLCEGPPSSFIQKFIKNPLLSFTGGAL